MGNSFILYGASGHAEVIIDILEKCNKHIIGVIDDNDSIIGSEILGYTVLGNLEKIKSLQKNSKLIVAVGSNIIRQRIVLLLENLNIQFSSAIHPTAVIGKNVTIGEGTVVMANAVINPSAVIGKHCIINTSATIDHDCILSDYVHLSPGVNLSGSVVVGEKSWLGTGTAVKNNISIGANSIIGVNSAVIGNIPDNSVFVGNPARFLKINQSYYENTTF